MSEDKKTSDETIDVDALFGPDEGTPSDKSKEGKDEKKEEETVLASRYKEAEKKITELGESNAEKEKWFKDNKDWLDPVVASPEIVEALRTGKLTGDLAKGIVEGKVSLENAVAVTEATEKVKDEVGGKKFEGMSKEEASKLVEAEVAKTLSSLREEVDSKFSKKALEDSAVLENSDFIGNTPDYADFADDIITWMEDHTNVWKLEDAYHAVKGMRITKVEADKRAEEEAEEKKRLASNAGGGGSEAGNIESNDAIDKIFNGNIDANI